MIELLAWADAGGPAGRRRRIGLEPARLRRRLSRPGDEAQRRADPDRAGAAPTSSAAAGRGCPRRRRRRPGWGLTGLEFGVNIPGTVGGAVRMNANAYGGELGRVLERVTVCTPGGRGGAAARGPRLPLPRLEPRRSRRGRAGDLRPRGRESGRRQGHHGGHAAQAKGGPALRDQDLRVDLHEPRGPAGRGPLRRAAARRGRLPRPPGRRRAAVAEARELRREHRRRHHRRHPRGDGGGPPQGPRALRRHAGAGGAGPGGGELAGGMATRA